MHPSDCFSDNTNRYLDRFQVILADMIREMTAAKPVNSISQTFIRQMIPHHRAAIEMSRNLLQYTTCIPLQTIAQNIITAQTKSIQDMQRARAVCHDFCDTRQALCAYLSAYEKISRTMFTEMRSACPDNNINISFMREMIPHHRGAVRMSKNTLSFPICPELKPILTSIIQSQEEGIRNMERLLSEIHSGGC